jgi:FkbM family methyltransferase
MLARSGMTGVTGNVYVGLHEFQEMGFLLHFLRPEDLFVDVGANVGSYTILAGASVGARVIAFEPDEQAFGWLERNVALNKLGRIEARREAVGAQPGTVRFTSGHDTGNRIDPAGPVTVPMTTLDAASSTAPALIKIDVEGYELDVLRGAARTLNSAVAVIMELNDAEASRLLESSGFACHGYDPFQRRLTPLLSGSANGIFVRDLEAATKRLREAKAFTVGDSVI